MRIGLATPIVTPAPPNGAPWELSAGIAELSTIAREADRLGFYHLSCGEHIVSVAGLGKWDGTTRGTMRWDPLTTFAYLAAITTRIRFATHVLVIGYHHPLEIAKRYGSLDMLSNGRVTLGIGVGTLKEEFELFGFPFADRGARADDALRALRVSLSVAEPSYDGPYFKFSGIVVEPHGVQKPIPIFVGGHSKRSLRRALELGNGWAPNATLEEITTWLKDVELPEGFELVLHTSRLDPMGEPEQTRDELGRLEDAGATILNARVGHDSLEQYLEQIESLITL